MSEHCEHCYQQGGKAAIQAATWLSTMTADRRTVDALKRLLYFLDRESSQELDAEVEAESAYWRSEVAR